MATGEPRPIGIPDVAYAFQPYTEELSEIRVPPFNVAVDVCELLRYYDGDEAAMFDMLGRLKDFLA